MGRATAAEIPLRFFDAAVAVRTDVPEVMGLCRDLFGRFRAPATPGAVAVEIVSEGRSAWRVRDPILDALVHERAWLPDIAAARLLELAGNEVRDHDLFHAAALAWEGRGLVLAGESGCGKSTLSMALLERGWGYLSDEVAALAVADGRLAPFPKAIELRAGTGALLSPRIGARLPGSPVRAGKTMVDPQRLFPGSLAPACPPAAVVFLEPPQAPLPPSPVLRLIVARRDEALPDLLSSLDGVRLVRWEEAAGRWPTLEITRDPGRFEAWRLDALLGKRGILILGSSLDPPAPDRFDRAPVCHPLRLDEGVSRLLTRYRGRHALARQLRDAGGCFGDLFVSLMRRLEGARFYRLQVGRLSAMLEQITMSVAWNA